jgi:ribosomal protein S18 acetylase RimI-like enzyme
MIALREARLPEDAGQIKSIDTGFTTEAIYTAYRDGDLFGLRFTTLLEPITKRFPLDDPDSPDRPWEFAVVAVAGDRICGFLAAGYQVWNRRLTLWHLYVDRSERRQGIARLLVDRAEAYGIGKGALHLWLETSSLNAPGVTAYRKLGFEWCGLDTTLYQGSPAAGETALFFARPILGSQTKSRGRDAAQL